MKFYNYYQKLTLLILACTFQVSFADQSNDFSVNINGTRIERVSTDAECINPEEQNALFLYLPSAAFAKGKHCRYQISDIHSITLDNEEPVYFEGELSEHPEEYSIIFYFRTASTPAEFLTKEKPGITYSKGVHCHSQFDPSWKSYLTSCTPESPETLTGVIRYDGDMWLQPPGECLTEDNHQGFMITLQPATIAAENTKLITSASLAEALSHTRTVAMVMSLDYLDLDLPKGIKSSYLINSNRFLQVNGLFSCCFRSRPKTHSGPAIVVQRWNEGTHHSTSREDEELSREGSVRSTASSVNTPPAHHRPSTPAQVPPGTSPQENQQALHISPL